MNGIFLFLCMSINGISHIVNFTLLNARLFLFSYNVLELCSISSYASLKRSDLFKAWLPACPPHSHLLWARPGAAGHSTASGPTLVRKSDGEGENH